MSVVRSIKAGILCVSVSALLALLGGASPAFALSPWWHLTSGSRPTSIQPGSAKNEVQEIAVSATEGQFLLIARSEAAFFKWDATHQEVQEGLEGIFGKGNVEVTEGPGDETGSKPYVIVFTGELSDRPVEPVNAFPSQFFLGCEGATGPDCKKEATVTEKTKGRPDGKIFVTATNLGDANSNGEATPVGIVDKLPTGLRATAIEGESGNGYFHDGPVECSLASLSCTYAGVLPPGDEIEVAISVMAEGSGLGEENEASIEGGGAPSASVRRPVAVGEPPSFGVEDYELAPEEEGGAPDTQAGSHPFQLTTTLTLNQTADENPVALAKDLHFNLPAGLIGNPTPFPQCTLAKFNTKPPNPNTEGFNECPSQTAVGVAVVTINGAPYGNPQGKRTFVAPVSNLEPAVGEPARFGFDVIGASVLLDTSLRAGGDYGVTVDVENITQTAAFVKNEVTFWGVPGDPRHDAQRGWGCLTDARDSSHPAPCNATEAIHPPPLLSLPTSCSGGPLQTSVEIDSWAQAGIVQSTPATAPMPTLNGCNRLPFTPSISVAPDGQAGSTPTGLTVGVHVPQDLTLNPAGLAEGSVKDTTVALPAGVALNPAAADGLQACSEAQVGLHSGSASSCPEASKVGTVEIVSPLLPDPLVGAAYLAEQNANPFGSLVALYIVAEDAKAGVLIKVAGEVKPDPVTGQLVSTFKNTPQLPFEDLKLHFFGGSRAPLGTPGLCGAYTTTASIVPWSGSDPVDSGSEFQVLTGPDGSACFDPLPFAPSLTAGTTSIQSGGFSPFTMTMSRSDGNQDLQAIQLRMPPGISGLLSSVKLCGEAQANAGTCGPESQIGETIVSVGLGGSPFSVKGGKVYITGPYKGAPFGLSIVNPAKAGPFDLEKTSANHPACDCLVVRAKLEVDPVTAAITVTSDNEGPYKIPTILEGIPLQIKHVNVTIDRPGFTFNPTNCQPMQITGTLHSTEGAAHDLSVPFQVTNCALLGFKPSFSVSTSGKTSRKNGASLKVKLTYPTAPFGSQTNIKYVKVSLPKQLPSELKTLQHACPHETFEANPAGCSAESKVGFARATTPLLPVPVEGPAYFVSYGGLQFPELIMVLQGYGVTIDLHAETFIDEKTGITSSTLHNVPDVPVGTFELNLPEGPFSALGANGNLCEFGKTVTVKKRVRRRVHGRMRTVTVLVKKTLPALKMPTRFIAQNGMEIKQSTPISVGGCPKAKKASVHKVGRRGRRRGK